MRLQVYERALFANLVLATLKDLVLVNAGTVSCL